MKPTDEKPESNKPLDNNDIEVLAGKPGYGSSRVVFTGGEGEKPASDGTFIGKNDWMADINPMVVDFINAGDSSKIFGRDDAPIESTSAVVFTDLEGEKPAQDGTFICKDDDKNTLESMIRRLVKDDPPIKIVLEGTPGSIVFSDGEEFNYAIEGELAGSEKKLGTDSEKAAFNKELDDAMNEWIKNPKDPAALEKVRDLTSTLPGAINDPNQLKPMAMVERLKEMMTSYPKFKPDELELGLPSKGALGSVNVAEGTVSAVGITGLDDLVTLALSAPPNAVFNHTLEDWITIRQQVSEGFDPVMLDFLRANADQFDPMRAEGEGVTLREVGIANAALIKANSGHKAFPAGSVWVAPQPILEALLSPKMAGELIQFAKDKGLEVDTYFGKKPKLGAESEKNTQLDDRKY